MQKAKDNSIPRLSGVQKQIMDVIWQDQRQLDASQIRDRLGGYSWSLSAVMTALARLLDKGFVSCDRSNRPMRFSAAVSETAYKERESREFLRKLHGGSVSSMVAAMSSFGDISEQELAKLREILDGLES